MAVPCGGPKTYHRKFIKCLYFPNRPGLLAISSDFPIPLPKQRARLGACKAGLSPQGMFITDRSNAILVYWF